MPPYGRQLEQPLLLRRPVLSLKPRLKVRALPQALGLINKNRDRIPAFAGRTTIT